VTSEHMSVQAAVSLYKKTHKKSPGPDGVTNETWTYVANSAIGELKIYNHSWSFRTLPYIWREAFILPISFDNRHT